MVKSFPRFPHLLLRHRMSRLGGRALHQVPLQHGEGDEEGIFNSSDIRLRYARDKSDDPRGCNGRTDDDFVCWDRKNGKPMEGHSRREWTKDGAGVALSDEI